MKEETKNTSEQEAHKPRRINPVGCVKPHTFAVGGKVFEMTDFAGVTARTIKERLKKADVTVSVKLTERICESINGKKKGE